MQKSMPGSMPSVSDIYATEEIEFLLDEIRDLEPVCCPLDDVQDFEIAGSRTGDLDDLMLDSPLGTCSSWDSHPNYKDHMGYPTYAWGVQLHCDVTHLKTPTGIVRIIFVLSTAVCLASECSAGTIQFALFPLPLLGRLRLMIFCSIFSLLVTCLMLFLDISHVGLMFPFNWPKVNTWMYLSIGLVFLFSSSLLLHMVLFAENLTPIPKHTKDTLLTSAILGYVCSLEAFGLSGLAAWPSQYREVSDDFNDLMSQNDREMTPLSPLNSNTDFDNHPYNNHNNHHRYSNGESAHIY